MTQGGSFRYSFSAQGQRKRQHGGVLLSDRDFHDLPEHMRTLTAVDNQQQSWAQDLLIIAKAAYLADRRSPRRAAPDGWTRSIALSVQLHEPDRWTETVLATVNQLLQFLTGDRWSVDIYGGATRQPSLHDDHRATHVGLFSGGLDSTAYAAELATRLTDNNYAVFVAYDWNLHTPQRDVFHRIKHLSHGRVHLHQIRLNPKAYGGKLDGSNRSRSLLFIATAVCLAAIHCLTTATVPENGQLAINPALTPGRISACSTRSVHPQTLFLINQIISRVGGNVVVHNPYLAFTKGDVCRKAIEANITIDVLQRTVSCGHPTTARAHHNPDYHCGHCFPCLVRRSGLHTALDDTPDPTGYLVDIAALDPHDRSEKDATDLRDLMLWLSHDFTAHDLIADSSLPTDVHPDTLMPVLLRGREELSNYLARTHGL